MPHRTDTEAPPEYKLYRTRPRLLQRGGGDGESLLDELRGKPPGAPAKTRRKITVGRVVKWIAERGSIDRDEFVDDIPFPETQNYVKRILGTAEDYRRLYGPSSRDSASR